MNALDTLTKTALPAIGSKLENGAWVLDSKRGRFHDDAVVLAFHSGAGAVSTFATWLVGRDHQPNAPEYFETLPYAIFNFTYER